MKWVFGTLLISDHLYLTLPSFYYLHNLKSYKVNTFLTLTFNRIPTYHGSSIRIRVRREDFQFEAGNYSLQSSITNQTKITPVKLQLRPTWKLSHKIPKLKVALYLYIPTYKEITIWRYQILYFTIWWLSFKQIFVATYLPKIRMDKTFSSQDNIKICRE